MMLWMDVFSPQRHWFIIKSISMDCYNPSGLLYVVLYVFCWFSCMFAFVISVKGHGSNVCFVSLMLSDCGTIRRLYQKYIWRNDTSLMQSSQNWTLKVLHVSSAWHHILQVCLLRPPLVAIHLSRGKQQIYIESLLHNLTTIPTPCSIMKVPLWLNSFQQ